MLLKILDRLEEIIIASLMGAATLLTFVTVVHRFLVDVPVLYPEIDAEDSAPGLADADDPRREPPLEDGDELVVSEWPDPLAPTTVASIEVSEENDDKDVSANQ